MPMTGTATITTIQATREAKVNVHGTEYSGIPTETCATCHNRGKRIGVSFQGLMETAYHSPYTAGGEGQPALHTKHYLAMHQDIHYQRGMTCQDCHTSLDVHSDGFLAAASHGHLVTLLLADHSEDIANILVVVGYIWYTKREIDN